MLLSDVVGLAETGRGGACPVMLLEQRPLTSLHRCGLVGLGVVVPEHVKDPVNHEKRDLVVDGAGMLRRLRCGNRRADDHISQQRRYTGKRIVIEGE